MREVERCAKKSTDMEKGKNKVVGGKQKEVKEFLKKIEKSGNRERRGIKEQ